MPVPALFAAARILESAARLIPRQPEPRLKAYGAGLFAYTQTLDISAARAHLAWTPKIPFEEGLASLEDLAIGAGRAGVGLGRRGLTESDRLGGGLGRLPLVGDLARGRAANALPDLLGAFTGALGSLGAVRGLGPLTGPLGSVGRLGSIGRGRPGLAYLIEPTGGPSVLHLGLGVHPAADEAAPSEERVVLVVHHVALSRCRSPGG